MQESFAFYQTSLGWFRIGSVENAVTRVDFAKESKKSPQTKPSSLCEETFQQMREYLAGIRQKFTVPIQFHGTDFQIKVWKALCDIPYGETRSYQDIAVAVGRPKAARAVGAANHRNPIAIIVPCHRVIGSHGALVGYASGVERKKFLLDLEQNARVF